MNRAFLFTVLMFIVTVDAAYSADVITAKTYVDRELSAKQDIIPRSGVNTGTTGVSVVMYTDSTGILGERGIFDPEEHYDYENAWPEEGHEDDLLPATVYAELESRASDLDNYLTDIYDAIDSVESSALTLNDFPQTVASYKTCTEWIESAAHTDENCLLWELNDKNVYGCRENGDSCSSDSDCCSESCVNSTCTAANNG